MNPFEHASAHSVEEVIAVLDDDCRPLAGGTDLLSMMKEGLIAPRQLVSLRTIPGLGAIREGESGWHVGATATLSTLARYPSVRTQLGLACLREAIDQSATPQLRHMATIGGNLVQHPRCWYYRNRLIPCWRKGGRLCYAARGENARHTILGRSGCQAVHPSDAAVALLTLEASVTVVGPRGERVIALDDFYRLPTPDRRHDHVLAPDEIITEVFLPRPASGSRSTYMKVAERGAWDFALASAAVRLTLDGPVVRAARIGLGGVAPMPWHASEAEALLTGTSLSPEVIDQAAQAATAEARPLEHNAYKVDLVRGVIRQALRHLM